MEKKQLSHQEVMRSLRRDRIIWEMIVQGAKGGAMGFAALGLVASAIGLYMGEWQILARETLTQGIPFWIWSMYVGTGLGVGALVGYVQEKDEI